MVQATGQQERKSKSNDSLMHLLHFFESGQLPKPFSHCGTPSHLKRLVSQYVPIAMLSRDWDVLGLNLSLGLWDSDTERSFMRAPRVFVNRLVTKSFETLYRYLADACLLSLYKQATSTLSPNKPRRVSAGALVPPAGSPLSADKWSRATNIL